MGKGGDLEDGRAAKQRRHQSQVAKVFGSRMQRRRGADHHHRRPPPAHHHHPHPIHRRRQVAKVFGRRMQRMRRGAGQPGAPAAELGDSSSPSHHHHNHTYNYYLSRFNISLKSVNRSYDLMPSGY